MKSAAYVLTVVIIASLLFISCGERKNPVIQTPAYQIVAQIPPVGVFKQLDYNGANSVIAADYAGIVYLDLSDPASPGPVISLNHPYFDDIKACYYNNDTKRLWYANTYSSKAITGAIWTQPDQLDVQVFTGSNPRSYYTEDAYHFEGDSAVTDSMLIQYIDWGENYLGTIFDFISNVYVLNASGFGQSIHWTSFQHPDAQTYDFAVSDDWHYAYLAVDKVGLHIIDLFVPGDAESIGSYDTEGFSRGVDVQGDYCYLADWHWGLQIFDVSDPTNPVRLSTLQFPGADDCEKVKVIGNKAAVMDLYDGIFAVDVSDPSNPVEMFNFNTITPTDIEVTEDYIFVVDVDAGLIIVSW